MVQFVEIAKVSRGHTLKNNTYTYVGNVSCERMLRHVFYLEYLPRQNIINFGRKLRKSQPSIPGIKWQIVSLAAADRWNQIYPYLKLKLSVTFMVIIFALPTPLSLRPLSALLWSEWCKYKRRVANNPSVFKTTEKAPTRVFSCLKAPTSASTFKRALTHGK